MMKSTKHLFIEAAYLEALAKIGVRRIKAVHESIPLESNRQLTSTKK